jgi:hypothetical protein
MGTPYTAQATVGVHHLIPMGGGLYLSQVLCLYPQVHLQVHQLLEVGPAAHSVRRRVAVGQPQWGREGVRCESRQAGRQRCNASSDTMRCLLV